MTRTDPDPVFAAAVREELVRGAAASSSGRPRRSRLLRVELLASFAVIAVVIAVLVGVQPAQPSRDDGPAARASTSEAVTSSPSPPRHAPLIGPTGARERTRAELQAFEEQQLGATPSSTRIWVEQAVLDTSCMAAAGFLYDPILDATSRRPVGDRGMTAAQERAYALAEYGPVTNRPYDWRNAGCHGRSVHETGRDHTN